MTACRSLFGGEAAVACGFGFLTGPPRFARAVASDRGERSLDLSWFALWASGVCAEADCAPCWREHQCEDYENTTRRQAASGSAATNDR